MTFNKERLLLNFCSHQVMPEKFEQYIANIEPGKYKEIPLPTNRVLSFHDEQKCRLFKQRYNKIDVSVFTVIKIAGDVFYDGRYTLRQYDLSSKKLERILLGQYKKGVRYGEFYELKRIKPHQLRMLDMTYDEKGRKDGKETKNI